MSNKALIEKEPSFGCRSVARALGFNTNTVPQILRIKGWQIRKRTVGSDLGVEAKRSAAAALEHTLIAHFGTLGRVETRFLLMKFCWANRTNDRKNG
ncbi:MAG: hypothetical protein AAFU61_00110 [Pseudomonadota bacterium]